MQNISAPLNDPALWSLAVPVCLAASAVHVLEPMFEQALAAADALDAEAK